MILNMCILPASQVYGQASVEMTYPIEQSTESVLTQEMLLQSMEGHALFGHFQRLLGVESGAQGVSNQLAARVLCDDLGLAPILLPESEKTTDPYVGRLEVEGIWDGELGKSSELLTVKEWNQLLDNSERYVLGGQTKTPYQAKLGQAKIQFEEIAIGKLVQSKTKLQYGEAAYPLYDVVGTSFVRINDLKQMGFKIEQTGDSIQVDITENMEKAAPLTPIKESVATSYKGNVQVGNLRSYSIKVGEEVLIPVRALGALVTLDINNEWINLRQQERSMGSPVTIGEKTLYNSIEQPINVTFTSLYWDGRSIQKVTQHIDQLPQGVEVSLPRNYFSLINTEVKYLTTLVDEVSYTDEWGQEVALKDQRYDDYGQNNISYYQAYEKGKQPPKTPVQETNLFPSSIIMGTMKYNTGSLKKGEKVEVWAAEKGSYYTVIQKGKKVRVPWGSVTIPSNPPVQKEPASKVQLESYINSKGFTSKTNYLVWTDLYRQRTYVFKKQGTQWVLHRQMLCSTGNNKTPTPRGEFTLTSYVSAFGMNKGYMCKNAVGIFDDYLYHSVMFDKTGSYQLSGVGKLGNQASSGCIRLSYEDSVWFYKNMPLGTKVWIN
ncbi:MAG: L,D-transpeptidase [Cellulosilyticaceae bacterium]